MWTHGLLTVLVLIYIDQARGYQPAKLYVYEDADEDPTVELNKRIIPISEEDGTDPRKFFLISHDSTPNGEKVKAGFNLFGIPLGPQFSITKQNEEKEVSPTRNEVKPVYVPLDMTINDDGFYEADYQPAVIRVPVTHLKQKVIILTAYAKRPALKTFPLEQDSQTAAMFIPDNPFRRNAKTSAGFELFGIPVGPQFIYTSDKNHEENGVTGTKESFAIVSPLLTTIKHLAKKLTSGFVME